MDIAIALSRYPNLSALLTASPEKLHSILGPIELALASESDIRIAQALIWHKASVANGLSTEELIAQIPEIPITLIPHRSDFPYLTLVAGHIGNVEAAKMADLKHAEYGYANDSLVPFDASRAFPKQWTWIRATDGTPNLGRKPSECRAECTGNRFAGTDAVGIAIHLIHGKRKHAMDLPGSVHADDRGRCAYVYPFGDPNLNAYRSDDAGAEYGTVVFVRE